jgi:Immunoglobulin domain
LWLSWNAFPGLAFCLLINVAAYSVPPTIEDAERILTVNESNEVVLPCVATGIPPPKITWTHEGRSSIVSGGRFEIEETGKLFISHVQVCVQKMANLVTEGAHLCKVRRC